MKLGSQREGYIIVDINSSMLEFMFKGLKKSDLDVKCCLLHDEIIRNLESIGMNTRFDPYFSHHLGRLSESLGVCLSLHGDNNEYHRKIANKFEKDVLNGYILLFAKSSLKSGFYDVVLSDIVIRNDIYINQLRLVPTAFFP